MKRGLVRPRLSSPLSFASAIGDAVSAAVVEARDADVELTYLRRRAPNALEWIVGVDHLNDRLLIDGTEEDPRPHWGIWRAIRDFFELRCPLCNSPKDEEPWGKTRAQLEDELLLRYRPDDDDDVCPKCAITRSELVEDGLLNGHNTFHCVVGMRAGKSDTLAMVGTYVEHVLVTEALRTDYGLHKYLGIPTSETLEVTFLASTDVQSKDTIWGKFVSKRRMSPWFQRYVPWVKQQEKRQKTPEGMKPWTYSETEKIVDNEYAKIRLNSLNSNSGGLVGRTRPAAFADEISRMKQTDSAMSADEVYRGLENSLQTVRAQVMNRHLKLRWLGLMASITSPLSVEDKGMRLLLNAEHDHRIYARRYATWDFNPRQPRSNFDQVFATDPIGAERDFGAAPPAAANPLIHDRARFRESVMDVSLTPTATFSPYEFDDPTGRAYIALKVDEPKLVLGVPHFCAFDAGKNFDAFAGAMGHAEETETGDIITVFDFIFRILTRPGQEVYFDCILAIIRAIHKKQNIAECAFDQWNSVHLIQQIRLVGIRAEQESLKNEDFKKLMRDGYLGRARFLPATFEEIDGPPELMGGAACAFYELERLERDPRTDKITNPHKGEVRGHNSDDVARVVAHVHRMVQTRGYSVSHDDQSARTLRKRGEAMASQWSSHGLGRVIPGGGKRGW